MECRIFQGSKPIAASTTPTADPVVLMPQPPEQRAFFLAGYRLALRSVLGPQTIAKGCGADADP